MLLFVSASAFAQQPRVGYINPQNVLNELPEAEQMEQELQEFIQEREAEFEERSIAFQNELAEFQQQAEQMGEQETEQYQQRLRQMDQELEEFQQRTQQELQERHEELLRPILMEMNGAIETVAQRQDLDFVLNEATEGGEQIILFVSQEGENQLNITQQVLDIMLN